jgi:hypothetical protein
MKKKSNKKERKNKMIFRCLQRHLEYECIKIIHHNKSLEIKMQELKADEEFVHQNNNT